jgi:hypothetical protein
MTAGSGCRGRADRDLEVGNQQRVAAGLWSIVQVMADAGTAKAASAATATSIVKTFFIEISSFKTSFNFPEMKPEKPCDRQSTRFHHLRYFSFLRYPKTWTFTSNLFPHCGVRRR